ncbi:polyhydroxyalkanoic acid synthase, partial [Bacillus thuringiensis]|nr:polyhydroxyalkanoic acid synthase [Bacillus thuringiensis]
MSHIHIYRAHGLGLAKARELALAWAVEARERLQLNCTLVEG